MISFSRFKHIFTSVMKVRKCKGGQLFDVDSHFERLEYQSALVLWDKVIFGFF
jgi:branched-subunit amino acid aminotransferase/4-amino-4-deoxychorismate lyase